MTQDVDGPRHRGAPIALLLALVVAAGAVLGLGVAVLHRQGVSLPLWDARSPEQKWNDAWLHEAAALTWPASPPVVRPYSVDVAGGDVVNDAYFLVDTDWACSWAHVWLRARTQNPRRAANVAGLMSAAHLSTTIVDDMIQAINRGNVASLNLSIKAAC